MEGSYWEANKMSIFWTNIFIHSTTKCRMPANLMVDDKKMNHRNISYLSLMMAQLMVGINIVGSKYLIGDMPILFVLLMRFVIAAVFLYAIYFMVADKRDTKLVSLGRRDWYFIIAQALCARGLFNLLLLLGYKLYRCQCRWSVHSFYASCYLARCLFVFGREHLLLIKH